MTNTVGTSKFMKLFTTKTGTTVLSFILDAIILITVVLKFIALFITARDTHFHLVYNEPKVHRKGLREIYYSMTIV